MAAPDGDAGPYTKFGVEGLAKAADRPPSGDRQRGQRCSPGSRSRGSCSPMMLWRVLDAIEEAMRKKAPVEFEDLEG